MKSDDSTLCTHNNFYLCSRIFKLSTWKIVRLNYQIKLTYVLYSSISKLHLENWRKNLLKLFIFIVSLKSNIKLHSQKKSTSFPPWSCHLSPNLFFPFIKDFLNIFLWGWAVCACHCAWTEIKGQLMGASSLLPPHEFQRWNHLPSAW